MKQQGTTTHIDAVRPALERAAQLERRAAACQQIKDDPSRPYAERVEAVAELILIRKEAECLF